VEAVDCAGLAWRPAARRSAAVLDPAVTDDSAPAILINQQAAAAGDNVRRIALPQRLRQSLLATPPTINLYLSLRRRRQLAN